MLKYILPLLLLSVTASQAFSLGSFLSSEETAEEEFAAEEEIEEIEDELDEEEEENEDMEEETLEDEGNIIQNTGYITYHYFRRRRGRI